MGDSPSNDIATTLKSIISDRVEHCSAAAASVTRPNGKRRMVTVSAKTKNKLRALIRDQEDGLRSLGAVHGGPSVESWLDHGQVGHDPNTVGSRRSLVKMHLLPDLRCSD